MEGALCFFSLRTKACSGETIQWMASIVVVASKVGARRNNSVYLQCLSRSRSCPKEDLPSSGLNFFWFI